jgi:hypothetical protein
MVVRRIAAGGDPKTVTVGEVACATPARRRAPARSPGSGARRGHHGPGPGGDLDWAEIGQGPAWPWQARALQGSEISTQHPVLVD